MYLAALARRPDGAPSAVVLGELGWAPCLFGVLRLQFSLVRTWLLLIAACLLNFALQQPSSWAHSVLRSLQVAGMPLSHSRGLVPGGGERQLAHWSRHALRPVLLQCAHTLYRGESLALPSVADYAVLQPHLHGGNTIHFSRLSSPLLREWAETA